MPHTEELRVLKRMRIAKQAAIKSQHPATSVRKAMLEKLEVFGKQTRRFHHGLKRMFDSFRTLYSFIKSSPICYRLFTRYSTSILTRTARNILGDGWKEATEVLVWQRNSNGLTPNYDAVLEDLASEFALERRDVSQLIANQRFFTSCAGDFSAFTKLAYPRTLAAGKGRTPCFSTGFHLPLRMFYLMWLLHLRFRYEPIRTFAARPCLKTSEYIDHYLVSRVMYHSKFFKDFIYSPECWDTWEKVLSRNLFSVWLKAPVDEKKMDTNPLLRQKMICHLIAVVAGGMEVPVDRTEGWREDFRDTFEVFVGDYLVKDVETLIREYGL